MHAGNDKWHTPDRVPLGHPVYVAIRPHEYGAYLQTFKPAWRVAIRQQHDQLLHTGGLQTGFGNRKWLTARPCYQTEKGNFFYW